MIQSFVSLAIAITAGAGYGDTFVGTDIFTGAVVVAWWAIIFFVAFGIVTIISGKRFGDARTGRSNTIVCYIITVFAGIGAKAPDPRGRATTIGTIALIMISTTAKGALVIGKPVTTRTIRTR